MSHLPTADDIAHFQAHGWWVSGPILSNALLDTLAFGVERYLAGEVDWPLWGGISSTAEADAPLVQHSFLALQLQEVQNFVHDPLLPQIAATLTGTVRIRLFQDQLVVKAPSQQSSAVGWHTDLAYWPNCTSEGMLTAWVPLQDVDASNGALAVQSGSHLSPHDPLALTFHDGAFEAGTGMTQLAVQRGCVSFHHCKLVHGSPVNSSNEPRRALSIHYQDSANAWRPLEIEGRTASHICDLLCRTDAEGRPDYEDESVFPVLWPSEAPR